MAEDYYHQQHHLHYYHLFQQQDKSPPPVKSRHRMKVAGGEIVEVQGGHIIRSTGRKDRHSKVCTAKGPRDRRVRLSAHTAIQFYDVQDRLGYDRPSKAIDWLIMKAKAAIDELAELPPWNPTAFGGNPFQSPPDHETHVEELENSKKNNTLVLDGIPHSSGYMFGDGSGTMKSSFYSSNEKLRLSLQSIQEQLPIPVPEGVTVFDRMPQANWSEQNMAMAPWTIPVHGNSHVFTQREPLQSSSNTIPTMSLHHQQWFASPEFASGEFFHSGFGIPARIQGEEEHVGFVEQQQLPSSSSSALHQCVKQQTEP